MLCNKKIVVCFIVIIALILNLNISYAYKKQDLVSSSININKGTVIEYGIKTCFKSLKNGQDLVKYFLSRIPKNYKYTVKNFGDNRYSIDFKNNKNKVYLIIDKIDKYSIVVMNVVEKSDKNKLNLLKDRVDNFIGKIEKSNKQQYEYLKFKLNEENLEKINDRMINILKDNKAINIETVKLSNGFSTCAYTKNYNPKIINGKYIDFNFAVCRYSSGNYIILGTPEIITTY